MCTQVLDSEPRILAHDDQLHCFTGLFVWHADSRCFKNARMQGNHILDFVRIHVEAGDQDHVLAPVEQEQIPGGIGTGKSTALKLIHALHMPTTGRVLVDGVPAGQIDPAVLRTHVALALQGAELFHGTIRSNITLAQPQACDDAVLQAARLAGAIDWILRLPRGIDTPVRERGAGLSGGQRQSLVLARALLPQPRVLLLDEPTSDMDPGTEQAVVDRLRPWLAGRTTLIVTHRPAMLALVDRLIVFENGAKRLDGPKASVLAAMNALLASPKAARSEEKAT